MTRIHRVSRNGCRNDTSVDDFGCYVNFNSNDISIQKITKQMTCHAKIGINFSWFGRILRKWKNRLTSFAYGFVSWFLRLCIFEKKKVCRKWQTCKQTNTIQVSTGYKSTVTMLNTNLLLQNGDALIFERFAEFDDLGPLGVDRERSDDHIGPLVDKFANQTVPLFLACRRNVLIHQDDTWLQRVAFDIFYVCAPLLVRPRHHFHHFHPTVK